METRFFVIKKKYIFIAELQEDSTTILYLNKIILSIYSMIAYIFHIILVGIVFINRQ